MRTPKYFEVVRRYGENGGRNSLKGYKMGGLNKREVEQQVNMRYSEVVHAIIKQMRPSFQESERQGGNISDWKAIVYSGTTDGII